MTWSHDTWPIRWHTRYTKQWMGRTVKLAAQLAHYISWVVHDYCICTAVWVDTLTVAQDKPLSLPLLCSLLLIHLPIDRVREWKYLLVDPFFFLSVWVTVDCSCIFILWGSCSLEPRPPESQPSGPKTSFHVNYVLQGRGPQTKLHFKTRSTLCANLPSCEHSFHKTPWNSCNKTGVLCTVVN